MREKYDFLKYQFIITDFFEIDKYLIALSLSITNTAVKINIRKSYEECTRSAFVVTSAARNICSDECMRRSGVQEPLTLRGGAVF